MNKRFRGESAGATERAKIVEDRLGGSVDRALLRLSSCLQRLPLAVTRSFFEWAKPMSATVGSVLGRRAPKATGGKNAREAAEQPSQEE